MFYVSLVAIIIIVLEVVFVVSIIIYSTKQRIVISKNTFLWFVPLFIFLLSLYLTAYIYNTQSIGALGVIESIVSSLKSFAFEINTKYITELFDNNVPYLVAFYIAYALAVFTVLASAIGLVKEYLLNLLRLFITQRKETDVLLGGCKSAFNYAKRHKGKCIIWINETLDNDTKRLLQQEKIPYIKAPLSLANLEKVLKKVRYNFIVFEGQENQYQSLISLFTALHNQHNNVFLYLEVKYQDMAVVRDQFLVSTDDNPNAYIKTFSRYELISRRFVSDNTLPKILPPRAFNENHSIKNDFTINVFFLGFGKVNSLLFSMFCQNNQLVTMVDDKLQAKLSNYYIVDQNVHAVDDRRIDNLLSNFNNMATDLPRPEPLCHYHKIVGNLNSNSIIENLKSITSTKNSMNLFIVSFGDDFENLEMAGWIQTQFDPTNTIIACRVKQTYIVNEKIICFGKDEEVLSHAIIVDEELQQLAKDINSEYNNQKFASPLAKEILWSNLSQIQLFSNYYAAMNIYFKLHLLGFDLNKDKKLPAVSKQEFMEVYGAKPTAYNYDDYFKTTTRNVIAYGEKLRWNAFYLFNGYRPLRLIDAHIVEKTHKVDYVREVSDRKLHLCLTSHSGLDIMHRSIVQKMKEQKVTASIEVIEKYKYDYMAFDNPDDNLFDSLMSQGYHIVKLKKCE